MQTMTRASLLVCAVLTVAACEYDYITSPTPQAAVLAAALSPANEVPPLGNPSEAGTSGSIVVVLTQTATGYEASFTLALAGIPPTSIIVGAHIHEGAPGAAGPIRVSTGLGPTAPIFTPTGGVEVTLTGIPVAADLAQAIIANPSAYYFNVHTLLNPPGVARGQLTRRQ